MMESTSNSIELELCSGTLGERHRKLNQLVRGTPADQLTLEALRDLSSQNRTDLVYFGRLANHVKNGEIICELLKSDSSMVVSVALQSKWLFTGTTHLHLINVQYFDKEIFPQATLHTIHRVVSTLGACLRNERLAEDFYQYVGEEFGKKMAFKLLPKCSLTFIRSKIMDNVCEVPCAQMFSIYKKDSGLAVEYLEKYLNQEKDENIAATRPCNIARNHCFKIRRTQPFKRNYDRVWRQLAEDKPELFLELVEKHHDKIKCQLGHRVADKILKASAGKIIENYKKFSEVFPEKYLVSALKGDLLEKYLYNALPPKKEDLRCYFNQFGYLKPQYRLQMLMKLHPMKYKGSSFLDRDDFLDWDLCKYLSKEERIKWAKKKIEKISPYEKEGGDMFVRYLDQSEGINKLKLMCGGTSEQHKRAKYLEYMVECCSINSDLEALLQLLKYVATRHRNDKADTRKMFLEKVKDLFTMRELSAEHWYWINEMIEFLCVENVIEKNCWQYFIVSFMKEHIHFCVLNNLNYVQSVEKIIKYNTYYSGMDFIHDGDIKSPEHRAQVRNIFMDKYQEFFKKCYESLQNEPENKNEVNDSVHQRLRDIVETLNKSKDTSVSANPWVLEYIFLNYKNWNQHHKIDILSLVRKDPKGREMFPNEIFIHNTDHRVLKNFVMFQPNIVTNNMKHFFNSTVTLKTQRSVYYLYDTISTYMRNPLGDELVKYLQQYIEEGNASDDKHFMKYLICNCYLLPYNEQSQFITRYAPKELKVNLANNQQEYECGQYFGKYMKTFDPPVQFDTLMPFVGGDYLKFSLTSLLSVCFKRPLNETKSFLQSLTKHPVSVKKHSIRLSYFILPRRELLPLYKALWETETNSTITDLLFMFTYKLLLTERDMEKYKEIWETLKYFMTRFDDKFKNVFKFLTKPQEIIPAFVNEYCVTCWQMLKILSSQGIDVKPHKYEFVKNISSCMQWLSEEFCENMITEYLSSFDSEDSKSPLLTFLVDYLVNAKKSETQTKHMKSTFSIFREFISKNWNTKVDEKYKYRSVVNNFVTKCCSQSLNTKLELSPINLLSNISAMLTSSLPQAAVLDLHTLLNITVCYIDLSTDPRFIECDLQSEKVTPLEYQLFENFGIKLNPILKEFCCRYGIVTTHFFKDSLDIILNKLIETISPDISLAEPLSLHVTRGILTHDATDPCYMYAVKSLPLSRPDDCEEIYDQILNQIMKNANLSMKLLLNERMELDSDSLKI